MDRFVFWRQHGELVDVASPAALGRALQVDGVDVATVWKLDNDQRKPVALTAQAMNEEWSLTDKDGRLVATIPFDPSDDPRVLRAMDFWEAELDGALRLIRQPAASESVPEDAWWPEKIAALGATLSDEDFEMFLQSSATRMLVWNDTADLPGAAREFEMQRVLAEIETEEHRKVLALVEAARQGPRHGG